MDKTSKESCLSCKLTSITCLFGVGAYLLKLSRGQKSKTLFVMGASSLTLGIGEIFDKSPFRN